MQYSTRLELARRLAYPVTPMAGGPGIVNLSALLRAETDGAMRCRSGALMMTGIGTRRFHGWCLGGKPMEGMRTKLAWRIVWATCLAVLASAATHAHGLSFDRTPDCGEPCSGEFWATATGEDVATAFVRQPNALSYRGEILQLAVRSGASSGAVKGLLRAGAPAKARHVLDEAVEHNLKVLPVLLDAGANPARAVRLLIEAGADPRALDSRGETPLDLAEGLDRRKEMLSEMLDHLRTRRASPPPPCGMLCEPGFWRTATARQVREALTRANNTRGGSPLADDPLHVALLAGADVELVRLLLDRGADPNARNWRDDTPLHVAARTPGGAAAIRVLLERGAMLEAANAEDRTPLHLASEQATTIDAMRVLLEAGANPNLLTGGFMGDTAWTLAARQSEGPEALKLLLEHGNLTKAVSGYYGLLPSAAGRGGHPETVAFLLDQGIQPNDSDASGDTALNYATSAGNLATLRMLLARGANPHLVSFFGTGTNVALVEAVGNPAAIELLVRSGADPNGHPRFWVKAPLHRAAEVCEEASLGTLLALGADPNYQDRSGDTPLGLAVESVLDALRSSPKPESRKIEACEKTIVELARHGANPHIPDSEGVTPLGKAKKHGVSDTIVRLLENPGQRRQVAD